MGAVATGHERVPAATAMPVIRSARYVSVDTSGVHCAAASMTAPLTAWAVKYSPGVTGGASGGAILPLLQKAATAAQLAAV